MRILWKGSIMAKFKVGDIDPTQLQRMFEKLWPDSPVRIDYVESLSIEDALGDSAELVTAAHAAELSTRYRYADLTAFPLADDGESFISFNPDNSTHSKITDVVTAKFLYEFYAANKGSYVISYAAELNTAYMWTLR